MNVLDHVAFGEVAMEPPSLTARPRSAAQDDEKPRVRHNSVFKGTSG